MNSTGFSIFSEDFKRLSSAAQGELVEILGEADAFKPASNGLEPVERDEICDGATAEVLFMPQLMGDLIQRLVERGVLEAEDATELIRSSGKTCAECNPWRAKEIEACVAFFAGFGSPRKSTL